MGQADQSGAVALEDTYQDEGYDYGAYDDGTIDPNTGMPYATGADGNKDDTRDVDPPDDVFLSKMKYLEMSRCWSCTDCDYQSIKPNVRHHVESNHLNLKYRCQ